MEKYAEISGSYLIFLITYLAVLRLTLNHYTGKKSCLIDVNYYTYLTWPKGHREPHNEVVSQSNLFLWKLLWLSKRIKN